MPFPPLRYVDAVPVDFEGERYICLQDPTGMVEGQLLLSPLAYVTAIQFDGVKEVEDVLSTILEQYGDVTIRADDIISVATELDEKGYLFSDTYHALHKASVNAYRGLVNREASLAGKSYPEDPEELRQYLDEQFTREGGPGSLPQVGAGSGAPLPGMIVPHIDYERGGHGYAHGYHRLAQHGRPDTVIVFGVAHMVEPVPFILTDKNFDTPFGTVQTDHKIVSTLAETCAWDPFEYELTHRGEHSVEFQAVMLAYLFGEGVNIVPVLCSDFSNDDDESIPSQSIRPFLDACRAQVGREDKAVTVIASADLAHVGKRFGDSFDIDDAVIAGVAQRDEEDLAHVRTIDADGFYRSVMRDGNERKVCGLGCIYSALYALDGTATKADALHYGSAPDPNGGIVSFTSIALA